MRVIRISANNVRVEMSEEEAEKYGIDVTAEAENGATRGTVRRLLEAVKRESGIDYCGERVFVRLLRSRVGCDMVISRLGAREPEKAETSVIRFASVGALIAACRTMDKNTVCDAYVGHGGAYLISASPLTGYGEGVDFSLAEEFVREHCRLVCEANAAKILGAL